jgi:hypothetical protein
LLHSSLVNLSEKGFYVVVLNVSLDVVGQHPDLVSEDMLHKIANQVFTSSYWPVRVLIFSFRGGGIEH